ncbi:hypothetical protein [Ectothiorhodospira mobilis]|uniref:hypothetical protein n=1 Tax=Ectothiorhodospira mobilis TaxID=195064 RepID=UPI00190895FE|nr:hypothetical protein [Ectothiorhodospira mobilis]MBK1690981.1 hypothetical protein [Ectothiorhodospira mobilis]
MRYEILKDAPALGRAGETVELTERQAKYRLKAGQIRPAPAAPERGRKRKRVANSAGQEAGGE